MEADRQHVNQVRKLIYQILATFLSTFLVLTELLFTDHRRSSVGVGVLGSLIYAVGGYDGNSRQCLASVEVYIPEQDAWKRVADMSARR